METGGAFRGASSPAPPSVLRTDGYAGPLAPRKAFSPLLSLLIFTFLSSLETDS